VKSRTVKQARISCGPSLRVLRLSGSEEIPSSTLSSVLEGRFSVGDGLFIFNSHDWLSQDPAIRREVFPDLNRTWRGDFYGDDKDALFLIRFSRSILASRRLTVKACSFLSSLKDNLSTCRLSSSVLASL